MRLSFSILWIILTVTLLAGMVSAFEWDNVKSYDASKKEVLIRDSFLGIPTTEVARARLNTEQKQYVGIGKDVMVAQFDINSSSRYTGIIDNVEIYDINKGMRRTNKEVWFKYKIIHSVTTTPSYGYKCTSTGKIHTNGSLKRKCEYIVEGTISKENATWYNYDLNSDIPEGVTSIGIFTDVGAGDNYEWIISLAGIRIPEWATWTQGLNSGLLDYWKLNETGTTANRIDSLGKFNITVTGTITEQAYGVNNNSWRGNGLSNYGTMGRIFNVSGNMTFSFWYNSSTGGYTNGERLFGDNGAYGPFDVQGNNCAQTAGGFCLKFNSQTAVDVGDLNRADWQHIVITASSSGRLYVWVNNTLLTNTTAGAFTNITDVIILGSDGVGSGISNLRWIDEIGLWNRVLTDSEISQIFNRSMTYQGTFDQEDADIDVTLNSPNANISMTTVTLNASGNPSSTSNVTNATFYVWWSNGTLRSTHINNTFTQSTTQINITSLVSGLTEHISYSWNAYICGTNRSDPTNTNCSFASSNFSIGVDTTGTVVNLTYPKNIVIPYYESGTNLTINFTATDNGAGVQACRLEYNGVNRTVGCGTNTTQYNITSPMNRTAIIWANDTLNNMASNAGTWNYTIFQHSNAYQSPVDELANSTFSVNITYNSTVYTSINTFLIYNGTRYTATKFGSSDNVVFNRSISVPTVTTRTNYTFYWEFIVNNGTADTYVNSSVYNQTVIDFTIDACGTNTVILYNFTMVDEGTQAKLNQTNVNTTLQVSLNISDIAHINQVANFSGNFTRINSVAICISSDLTNTTYRIDGEIKYEALTYEPEFYNLQNSRINNSLLSTNITLYDLLSSQSQSCTISYKNKFKSPVAGALIEIQRRYTDQGLSRVVEIPITDTGGTTIAHIVTEDVEYDLVVKKENVLLDTYRRQKFFLDANSLCIATLSAEEGILGIKDYETKDGVAFTPPTFNRTSRLVSTTFSTLDGSIRSFYLNVSQYNQYGNVTVCTNTQNLSSGTLSCTVPSTFGNGTYTATILLENKKIGGSQFSISQLARDTFGGSQGLLIMMFFLSVVLMLIGNGPAIIIGVIISVIGMLGLNYTQGTLLGGASSLLWLVVIAAILLWKYSRQRG